MALFGRNRGRIPGSAEFCFRLAEFETADSDRRLVGRGYTLEDVVGIGRILSIHDADWLEHGVSRIDIVGESHRLEALQDPSFNPGCPIRIVPEPTNEYDRNALKVMDQAQRLHVGYVSRDDQGRVRGMLNMGDTRVISLWSWYGRDDGERRNLRLLAFTPAAIDGGESFPPHPRLR